MATGGRFLSTDRRAVCQRTAMPIIIIQNYFNYSDTAAVRTVALHELNLERRATAGYSSQSSGRCARPAAQRTRARRRAIACFTILICMPAMMLMQDKLK
eukprot:SAG31_NODE_1602_length_7780_cov_8.304699_4_plen_100_part_00